MISNGGGGDGETHGGEDHQNNQHYEDGGVEDQANQPQYYDGEGQDEGEGDQLHYEDHYEDDGNGGFSVTKRLVGSRIARKQAEDDVKLLANRIALLKMEEQKAWKKIEETKKKAKDIMHVKQRNQEQNRIKEQRKQEKQLEEQMLLERNQNMKNNIKDHITMTKEQLQRKQFQEAERVKQEKREQQEFLMMQKQQEQFKASSIKQMVRNQQQEAEQKRRLEAAEKKARARAELQQKIIKENQRRLQIEAEVAMMEQEELELIKRLQNTQIMQKTAYDDLENALNGSFNRGNGQEQNNQLQNPQLMMSPNNDKTPNKGLATVGANGSRPQTSQSSSGVKYKQQQMQPASQKNNN